MNVNVKGREVGIDSYSAVIKFRSEFTVKFWNIWFAILWSCLSVAIVTVSEI